MRTSIDLDDNLMIEIMTISKAKTKKEAMYIVMVDYIRKQKMKELAALKGKFHWEGNLDEMRQSRFIGEWD